jgi:two-component system, chemotaxis family, protein-glutamate methylesterase/glutaminase
MPRVKRTQHPPTEFTCPDCAGVLKLERDGSHHRDYRCQVGHHFSTRSLLIAKEKEVERVLWSAAALLEHVVLVYGRLMEEVKGLDQKERRRLEQRIREARRQQAVVTGLIENTHAWE